MTITKDASTPANVNTSASVSATNVTASFSPPAGSLVVVVVNIAYSAQPTAVSATCKDSNSVAYTSGAAVYDTLFCYSAVFSHYYATAPGSITVTVTRSGTGSTGSSLFSLTPYVLDGAASVQSAAQSATGSSAGAPTTADGVLTPTVAGSWVIAGAATSDDGQTYTSLSSPSLTGDNNNVEDTTDIVSCQAGHFVTTAAEAGSAQTAGWTYTNATDFSFAALEVIPAVAYDAVGPATGDGQTSVVSPLSWTHIAAAGAAVVVGVVVDEATTSDTCTATYGGTSMTLLGSVEVDNGSGSPGNDGFLYVFGLANVPSGSSTVSVTFSTTTDVAGGGSISFTGAAASAAFGTFQSTTAGTGTQTLGFTTVSADSQVCGFDAEGGTFLTGMSSGNSRFLEDTNSNGLAGSIGGGTSPGTGGTVTLTWGGDNASTWAVGGVEVLPALPVSGPSPGTDVSTLLDASEVIHVSDVRRLV